MTMTKRSGIMDQYVRLVGSIRKNASEERDIKIVRMVGSIRMKTSGGRSNNCEIDANKKMDSLLLSD